MINFYSTVLAYFNRNGSNLILFYILLVFINQNTALIVGAGTLLDGAGERDSISISSCQLYYLIKGKCPKKLTDANGEMLIRIKSISIKHSTS